MKSTPRKSTKLRVGTASALASVALLLAACGDDAPEPVQDDDNAAEGEVLEGTISDAMLPLDTLRSEAPPIAGSDEDEGAEGATSDDGENGDSASDE